jgi:hypothetical protein
VTGIDQARTDVQQAVRALLAIADSAVPTSAASAERRLWSEMLALGRAIRCPRGAGTRERRRPRAWRSLENAALKSASCGVAVTVPSEGRGISGRGPVAPGSAWCAGPAHTGCQDRSLERIEDLGGGGPPGDRSCRGVFCAGRRACGARIGLTASGTAEHRKLRRDPAKAWRFAYWNVPTAARGRGRCRNRSRAGCTTAATSPYAVLVAERRRFRSARRTPCRSLAAVGTIATTGSPAEGGAIGARAVQCNGLFGGVEEETSDHDARL